MISFSSFIWVQASSPCGDNVIKVDGRDVSPEEFEQYFRFANPNGSPSNRKSTPEWNQLSLENKESGLRVYKTNDGYFLVDSHFVDTDVSGRTITYFFCCRSNKLADVAAQLHRQAKDIGYKCHPLDLAMLEFNGHVWFVVLSIIAIVIIFVLIILLIIRYAAK